MIFELVLLVSLFFVLGRAAELVAERAKDFSLRTGVSVPFLGLILGLLTSLPEMSVALNATIRNAPEVSIGNLLGGILVLFGLIHGGGIVLNRKIKTHGSWWLVVLMFLYLSSFAILGLNGTLNRGEGVYLVFGYFLVAISFYISGRHQKHEEAPKNPIISLKKELAVILICIAAIVGTAHLIMGLALSIFTKLGMPELLIGLLVFSVGTNLPELVVTIQSWRHHIRDLSVGHIFGSAIVNGLIAGVSAIYYPITIHAGLQYGIIVASILAIGAAYTMFFRSGHNLNRSEGVILVLMFVSFFILQIIIA
jgi:cation:H+ antiporter